MRGQDEAEDDGRRPAAIRPGVAAIVFDARGRVLLHRRAGGGLAPPSGSVEPGEALETALERELREETGLAVRVLRPVGIYSYPDEQVVLQPDGSRVHFVTTVFSCRVEGGQLERSSEGSSWRWLDPQHLPAGTLPYALRWIRDATTVEAGLVVR